MHIISTIVGYSHQPFQHLLVGQPAFTYHSPNLHRQQWKLWGFSSLLAEQSTKCVYFRCLNQSNVEVRIDELFDDTF
jgi:hypothetical protein